MKIISAISILALLSGCQFFQGVDELTIEQKARLVSNTASSATFVILTEVYDESSEQVEHAIRVQNAVETFVLPALEAGAGELTTNEIKDLLSGAFELEPQQQVLLTNVLDSFLVFYTGPTMGEVVPEEYLMLVRALADGVIRGCEMTIALASEVI